MQALIIGCGYLGRRVAAKWRSQGHAVFAMTRSAENAGPLREQGIEPIIGDVLNRTSLQSLPAADIVLYAVGFDRRAGVDKRQVYVDGLANVLEAIAPRVGRLIYISSTSVYGQDAGEWIDETSPCVPATDDGRICRDAEQTVWRFVGTEKNTDGARGAIVLRFSGIYGPDRLLRRIEAVRTQEPIRANPEGFLNLIHVDDGARIVAAVAERGRSGATYLVSDNQPVRRREYYALLARLVGAAPPVFQTDPADAGRLNKRCSNARLRTKFGDVFQFPTIETGLAQAITSGAALPPN